MDCRATRHQTFARECNGQGNFFPIRYRRSWRNFACEVQSISVRRPQELANLQVCKPQVPPLRHAPVGMTILFVAARAFSWQILHPHERIVIPTVAKRSGGICSAPCGSLQSFLGSDPPKKSQPPTGGIMGRWPTQADENQHLFSNPSPG